MRVLFLLFFLFFNAFAGWMFVNDDGSLTPYTEEENYIIPEEKMKVLPEVVKTITKHKEKKVEPRPKQEISYSEGVEKTMYLTFDDGPLAGSTNIISVLEEEAVPATMFMVGKHASITPSRKEVYQRAIDAPSILVANHTYAHANGKYRHFYSDKTRVLEDIFRMDAMLARDDIHHDMRYMRLAGRNVFRLPGLSTNDMAIPKKHGERSKYDALYEAGFFIYGWDLQWRYEGKSGQVTQSPEGLARKIERMYAKGKTKRAQKFILLMHDFSFKNRLGGKKILTKLIHILRQKGWRFETLETYL